MTCIRDTMIYTLEDLCEEVTHPELVRLSLPEVAMVPFDIGALAYSVRDIPVSRKKIRATSDATPVDEKSLRQERIGLVEAILDVVVKDYKRQSSIYPFLGTIRLVIDWFDLNNHQDVFLNPDLCRRAYLDYIAALEHKLHVTRELGKIRCSFLQSIVKRLIELKFGKEAALSIIGGIKTLRFDRFIEGEIPEEMRIRNQITVLLDLAQKLSAALMEVRPFPFVLDIAGQHSCFLPYVNGMISTERNPKVISSIDTSSGSILNAEEIVRKHGIDKSDALNRLKGLRKTLKSANSNPHCRVRNALASLALQAYANIFIYITAASAGELCQFDFDDGVLITEDTLRKQLKAIKLRANGRVTKYTIGRKTGLRLLREYLKFRKWVARGEECDQLFISFRAGLRSITGLSKRFQWTLWTRIRDLYFDASAENISPKLSRKVKSVVLLSIEHSLEVVADVLNHTEEVNIRHYSHPSIDGQRREYSNYWAAVRKVAQVVQERDKADTTSIAAGQCNSLNNPEPSEELIPIQPICESQLGCLYCVHFSCHADEEDTFKILSLAYVIETVRAIATAGSQTIRLFKDLDIRLAEIISAISSKSDMTKGVVEKVRHRVFELGELTPFWESRLQRYERMGIL